MEELVKMGYLTADQYGKALAYQKKRGCKIGVALMELGFVNDRIMQHFARRILGK
jgi:hypothetical protein